MSSGAHHQNTMGTRDNHGSVFLHEHRAFPLPTPPQPPEPPHLKSLHPYTPANHPHTQGTLKRGMGVRGGGGVWRVGGRRLWGEREALLTGQQSAGLDLGSGC